MLFATASIIYILKNKIVGKYIYLAILFLIIWIVFRTGIITDKRSKDDK